MKKIKILALAVVMFLGVQSASNAIQTTNLNEQKAINKNVAIQARETGATNPYEAFAVEKLDTLVSRYYNNLRECEPLHISEYIDIFGLKVGFKIDMNGWVDNKCSLEMTGKISGIGKDIRDVFEVKISDDAIAKIEPLVKCNFTKDQMNIIVDAIIARNQKNETQIRQMLEKPTKKYKDEPTKLTKEEEALVAMLMSGGACTIPNQEELMKNLTEIMMPTTTPPAKNPNPINTDSKINMPQAPTK